MAVSGVCGVLDVLGVVEVTLEVDVVQTDLEGLFVAAWQPALVPLVVVNTLCEIGCNDDGFIDTAKMVLSGSPHLLQYEPQCAHGAVQPRLHRAFSNLQIVGDVGRRPSQVVRAPNDRKVHGGQLRQSVTDH